MCAAPFHVAPIAPIRIGIDVGGTHTDAVLLDGERVAATHKVLTSADVTTGIREVLAQLLGGQPRASAAEAVMIGTTQFTNAVVERKQLTPVAAVRLGAPSGHGLPPMIGWPDDIARVSDGGSFMLQGGYLYNGAPLSPLQDDEITQLIDDLEHRQASSVAITSAFSPMNAEPECEVAERIAERLPEVRITLSHQLGRIGLLERENAAILNAALLPFAAKVCQAMADAVRTSGLTCPIFITQNDGTLMDLAFCREFPAFTFASGPTNSLRGAAKLTGLEEAIVVDIGGTTTDIGVLRRGFPRESNLVVEVGGVRTNFRMPDILAIGLGGGSLVGNSGASVGPSSVGHRLVDQALVFGGDTLTATDLAVAAGHAEVGDPALAASIAAPVVERGLARIDTLLESAIGKMNPGKAALPVVLVGGGALIAPDRAGRNAAMMRPLHCDVANAIGAAIAQIGGEAERFVAYGNCSRDNAIQDVMAEAQRQAVAAGADPASLKVSDIEEVAIPYMDNASTRVRVKVIGDVAALSPPEATGAAL